MWMVPAALLRLCFFLYACLMCVLMYAPLLQEHAALYSSAVIMIENYTSEHMKVARCSGEDFELGPLLTLPVECVKCIHKWMRSKLISLLTFLCSQVHQGDEVSGS